MAVTVVSLLLLSIVLQLLKGRDTPTTLQTGQLYLPSAAALDRMALSFDSVVADVYWIRALQYFGTTRRSGLTERNYDLLYPLLDIATTLDPRFSIAYRFGAIFLTEPFPDGPGRPDQAVTLLQKGAQHMPERWEYLMDTGFVYYWSLHDYAEAARWFRRAAAIPGSPWWLQDETLRRLMQLDALDDIDRLVLESERFSMVTGRWPETWSALVETGRLPGPPADPFGHGYLLDHSTRTVGVSPESPLLPLPNEPPRVATP